MSARLLTLHSSRVAAKRKPIWQLRPSADLNVAGFAAFGTKEDLPDDAVLDQQGGARGVFKTALAALFPILHVFAVLAQQDAALNTLDARLVFFRLALWRDVARRRAGGRGSSRCLP